MKCVRDVLPAGEIIGPLVRLFPMLLCVPLLLGGWLRADAADAPRPPRVLVVNSFGTRAPPFTTHSTAFETTLTREMGTRVDLDEVSLDMARFDQPDMEDAFAELLRKRLATWRPDLVVSFGSPAGLFVAKYRGRLFPLTPVVYDGMDKSRLPPDALDSNAAFVGSDFDLRGLVEDILQLKPDTDHVVVILGSTPLERYWATAFGEAFGPLAGRVRFTFVNDLSFDEMLGLVSKLPPRSFVLLGLLLRDASGVTHNATDALQRLNAVTAAPINGIYQHELGLGIVGGRLYQGESEGVEGARVAIRILRGEPPSGIPPKIIGPAQPSYDWRELRRWNIPEGRLLPGSTVLFRQPTPWERYRGWILAAVGVIAVEGGLIASLVVQRRRRRRAQDALCESQQLIELATGAGELGLWSRDLTGGHVWLSGPMRSLLGFAPDVPVGYEDILPRIHPDDRSRMLAELNRTHADGLPFEGELRFLLPDGTQRWVLSKGRTVTGPDLTPRRMGVVLDVTGRKQAEAELRRHRDELAHVSRVTAMGELAGSLAHELNQPLSAILANAQAAEHYLSGGHADLDEVRNIVHDIVDSDKRASEIIRRIHVLVKKDAPQHFVPLEPAALIHEIVRLVHGDAASRRVRLSVDIEPDLPTVRGIRVQVQQVLLNLLLNAFAATKDCAEGDRQILVRAVLDGDGMVCTSIRDRGTGLPPESVEKVFQPFFTTKPDGLGMGLSISRSIIEAHGGRLWGENNPDGGATFSFTIPPERADRKQPAAAAAAPDLAPTAR
jgi:signal transduction histidine kinase